MHDPYCDPEKPVTVTFEDVSVATYMIRSGIINTECIKSEQISAMTECEIYLKKEYMQVTGSFKERGARYSLLKLSPHQKKRGIVAASAGNHALACCYHGHLVNVPVTVVMPETAPIMKIQKCKNYKANVIVFGKNLLESKKFAMQYARDHEMMYLNGYDHPNILAGQGSIGLEILEQVPDLDAVIVPVGGGGLIAGVGVAIKELNENIQVIGVEPERAPCFYEAMKAGDPVNVAVDSTLADGLAVAKIGVNSFETAKNVVDKVVTVSEHFIALSILRLVELENAVVEGAGAIPLGALMCGQLDELKGKKVCLILSGGNIDTTVLGRVLDRGLAADGRMVKAKVTLPDRPGAAKELCNHIGRLGVSIKDIMHERAWVMSDAFSARVKVVCETRNYEHSLDLRNSLIKTYGEITFNGVSYSKDSCDYPSD